MNFQVELHNYCQFTCGICPNKDMERKREFMSDEVWQTILHKYIVPYKDTNASPSHPPTFIGHKDSEPLIDRKFLLRLGDLSKAAPDMNIDIYSNGVLLPKWSQREQDVFAFLATLPNRCRYLMSYHPNNHDYSENDYAPTVAYLKGILQNPPANVEFITVSHQSKWVSQDVQAAWRETWRPEIDRRIITVHSNCSINPWTGLMEDVATCKFDGCPYSDFGHFFFGVTGNVIACCLDLEEAIVFGNVMRDDPAEMFEKVKEFYAAQTRREVAHAVCNNCFGLPAAPKLQQLGVSA